MTRYLSGGPFSVGGYSEAFSKAYVGTFHPDEVECVDLKACTVCRGEGERDGNECRACDGTGRRAWQKTDER
jgi:DnaJ-class molecular chaperone